MQSPFNTSIDPFPPLGSNFWPNFGTFMGWIWPFAALVLGFVLALYLLDIPLDFVTDWRRGGEDYDDEED